MLTFYYEPLDAETAAIVEAKLPKSAAHYARLIGLPATFAMIAEYGGSEIFLQRGDYCLSGEQIAATIGRENLEVLRTHLPLNEGLYIPRATQAIRALRNRRIAADYRNMVASMSRDRTLNVLALRYDMSRRWVEEIVRPHDSEARPKTRRCVAAANKPRFRPVRLAAV